MNKKSITREPKNHEKDWTHPISLWPPFLSCQANPCLLWCLDILVQEFHPLRFSAMNHAHWFSREGLNTPFSSQVKWCILFYNNFPKMSYYSAVRLAYKLCEWFCRSLFQIKFTRRVKKLFIGQIQNSEPSLLLINSFGQIRGQAMIYPGDLWLLECVNYYFR